MRVGPGGIQLRHELAPDPGTGWEALDESELVPGQRDLFDTNPHTASPADGAWIDPFEEEPEPGRRVLPVWSRRSRSNMVRTLAMIDWAPVYEVEGRKRAMVTLTYPGDWRAAAPTAADSWGHFDRFVKLWERSSMGKLSCVWKREFQRRGAPHFHIAAAVPERVQWKCNRWCHGHDDTIRDFVRLAWARVVGVTDPEERKRHELAGTAVDFAEGAQWIDPKRLAVYFTRHAAKGSASKEHQHIAPKDWDGPGRWWGLRRVEKLTAEAELSPADLLELRRIMRAWEKAQGAGLDPRHPHRELVGNVYVTALGRPKRMRNVKLPRGGVSSEGTVRQRWSSRPYATASLSHSQGGFLVVNSGPELLGEFARWLQARGPGGRARRAPLP